MESYLKNNNKSNCFGCEACASICPKSAITMKEDEDGFRYPYVDKKKCINCGLCHKVCYFEKSIEKYNDQQKVFGGYNKDWNIRNESTSGGAFSAIIEAYCDDNYVIFGAVSNGLEVNHKYVTDKKEIGIFRKSKYSQSRINDSYKQVKEFLKKGLKVAFSGTPCQIAGLRKYLLNADTTNLLTIEVVCEGVPSPLYIRKLEKHFLKKYQSKIKSIDYRYTDSSRKNHGKWDFEVMKIVLENGKVLKKDRWFNPFWQIWLNHLMSRPSCYDCQFCTNNRIADITLGDLWGVHLYCQDLYGHNGGSSLMVANSAKGKDVMKLAEKYMHGRELLFSDALKYQSPMRKCISNNDKRDEFIRDLKNDNLTYKGIVRKWYKKPTIKLLWSKYIWGNRQKVFFWNLKNKRSENNERND